MKDNDQGMFLINSDPISSLFVSEVLFDGILGTTRVRKGMLGSLPQVYLHLLYLVVNILSIHRELHVTEINMKRFDD